MKVDEISPLFIQKGESVPNRSITVKEAIKRNNITAFDIKQAFGIFDGFSADIIELINTNVKYEGYIVQQYDEIEKNRKQEEMLIPENFDFLSISGIKTEAKQKLDKIRPRTIGQASRISGVSPADISVLIILVKTFKKENK